MAKAVKVSGAGSGSGTVTLRGADNGGDYTITLPSSGSTIGTGNGNGNGNGSGNGNSNLSLGNSANTALRGDSALGGEVAGANGDNFTVPSGGNWSVIGSTMRATNRNNDTITSVYGNNTAFGTDARPIQNRNSVGRSPATAVSHSCIVAGGTTLSISINNGGGTPTGPGGSRWLAVKVG